ncbi:hypothetical protein [Mesorhizobium sp. YR577]|jgi:hypothetical protein|uniref:hypothetical protein n=1 Tax=Mesorhizobium sp. YR577 TaxID=1884373 RepID=UPI0008ED07D6|nr:hypothetical protein [Mesorhizobium sp. YR577]SFT71423.1 hypothetical protein SAMN05518861_10456 [Mesorhizobium sp. YR577]
MATTVITSFPQADVALATWTSLVNGETGNSASITRWSNNKTVTVTGTFGAGGSVAIQGSNDGSTFVPLHDPRGVAIAITTAGAALIEENPLFIRAVVTAGDGTTNLKVMIAAVT